MSAYFETGFSVRQPMWHGQGEVLTDWPTSWPEARVKAGLDWEPMEEVGYRVRDLDSFKVCIDCAAALGDEHAVDHCFNYTTDHPDVTSGDCLPLGSLPLLDGRVCVPIAGHKVITRNDRDTVLGIRSEQYSLIYHGEDYAQANGGASMEEIMEAFRNADGSLRFETAGSLKDGGSVWALLYLDEPYTTPGDDSETYPFLGVINHHGIAGGCDVLSTQVRIVCWNTMSMAEADADRTGRKFTFRHSGDVASRIDEAKEALAGLRTEAKEYQLLAADLSALNVDDEQVRTFTELFLPSPRDAGEQCSDRVQANVDKARAMFKHLYLDSATTEGIRGTGWGLLQTATEYTDHIRDHRTRDSWLGRTVLGRDSVKTRALNIVRGL